MASEFSPKDTESNPHSPSQSLFIKRRCCFCIPYRWHKVNSSSNSPDHTEPQTLWSRGIDALKKLREWSEIVAGPRWKTFIRRFNRNKSSGRNCSKFQYDPLGYALNFDQGPFENGDSEIENEYIVRNFSSRYALRTNVSKTTSDGGKDVVIGPNFV
ncbi:hypothetical protein HanRHA438_Chr02g0053241 [Helianthus annuus]|nr:hypothetical protein HanHA89_Chr02g0045571 [Helianthus annuus]KAJ0938745.1 hypothetical protein HanRHA438_Chr02g0053241 [Helianthus annuus]KAJ0950702.1 hypothetical protein HanPSC8_Chr02g0051351 [Helianthus annuus]